MSAVGRAAWSCSGSRVAQQSLPWPPPEEAMRYLGVTSCSSGNENYFPVALSSEFGSSLFAGGYILGLCCFAPFSLALCCTKSLLCPHPSALV